MAPRQRSESKFRSIHVIWRYMRNLVVVVGMLLHFEVVYAITYEPMRKIINSDSDAAIRLELKRWCKRKANEAGYVQVAGAVMFASVTGCLSWTVVQTSHWSGPALWYSSIVFAITSIFLGAQQTLVLPDADSIDVLAPDKIESMKRSFMSRGDLNPRPSRLMLFIWQAPIMLLGCAVFSFLAGLCSVVLSPLARKPSWNEEAKTAVMFTAAATVAGLSFLVNSKLVHQLTKNGG